MGCGSSTGQPVEEAPCDRYAAVKSLRTSRQSTDTEASEAAMTAESMTTFVTQQTKERDSFDGVSGDRLSEGVEDCESHCSMSSKGSLHSDDRNLFDSPMSGEFGLPESPQNSPRVFKRHLRRAIMHGRSVVSLDCGSLSSPRSYGSAKSLARLSQATNLTRYSSKNLTSTCPTTPEAASTRSPYSLMRILSRGTLHSATASAHRVVHARSLNVSRSISQDRLMYLYATTSPLLSLLPLDVKEYLISFIPAYHFVKSNNTLHIERDKATVQKWMQDDAIEDVWMEPLVKIMPGIPKGKRGRVCLKQGHQPQSFNTFGAVCDDLLPLMGSNNLSSSTVYAECSNTGGLSWWSDGKKCPEDKVQLERGSIYTISIDNVQSPAEVSIVVASAAGTVLATHSEKIYGTEPDSVVYAAAYLFDEGESVELCPCAQP